MIISVITHTLIIRNYFLQSNIIAMPYIQNYIFIFKKIFFKPMMFVYIKKTNKL